MPRLATPLNLVIVAILVIVTLAGFVLIPADAPLAVHWQLDGRVDATLPRNLALLQMPVATLLVWAIVYAIGRWGNSGRGAGAAMGLRIVLPGVTALFALIQLVIVLGGLGLGGLELVVDGGLRGGLGGPQLRQVQGLAGLVGARLGGAVRLGGCGPGRQGHGADHTAGQTGPPDPAGRPMSGPPSAPYLRTVLIQNVLAKGHGRYGYQEI